MSTTSGKSDPREPFSEDFAFYISTGLVFAISIAATIYFCGSMSGGMKMPGGWTMSMMWMRMPNQTWLESALIFLLVWLTMMVAMMLPSALPMLLNFRRSLAVEANIHSGISTLPVACGYFVVWVAIGAVLYSIGVAWVFALMRWPGLSFATPVLTGIIFILAGVFQFSPWKKTALGHCRNPLGCRSGDTHRLSADWFYGVRQGVHCGTCCSGLMLAFVAVGMMNPFLMITIAAVIALEKLLGKPQQIVYITGVLAVFSGIALVIRSLH